MSLADLLKKGSLRQFATVTGATAATVRPDSRPSVATVATVSVATGPKQAANDPAQVSELVASIVVATPVTSPAALFNDPDRWAWPHSQAMTGREIDTFTARLARFTGKVLSVLDGKALADKLVTRDREADERRLCLECVHLAGHAAGAWGCKNWQRAGVAVRARDAQLSAALVYQPQRCDGFKDQNHQEITP